MRAALVAPVDEKGQPVPVASMAALEGRAPVPVGYDGQAYVEGLAAQNRLTVSLPEGGTCVTAAFAFAPTPGDIPKIGPITCRRSAAP